MPCVCSSVEGRISVLNGILPRSDQKILITPALSLLNAHGGQFDAAQVLELLPHDWPVTTVKAFLMRSIRGSMDTYRTGKIEYNLARGENLRVSPFSLSGRTIRGGVMGLLYSPLL